MYIFLRLQSVLTSLLILVCTNLTAATLDENLSVFASKIVVQQEDAPLAIWASLQYGGQVNDQYVFDVTDFGIDESVRSTAPFSNTISSADFSLRIPELMAYTGQSLWTEFAFAPEPEHQLRFQLTRFGAAESAQMEPSQGNGNTYYVSNTGDDGNDGSFELPWQSIQFAVDQVEAGDTVFVRSGSYSEQITITQSGSDAAGFIRILNYPSETPIIDGSDLSPREGDDGLILIIDKHHIVIRGFEIRNYQTSSESVLAVGIHIRGNSHNVHIRDNRIHNISTFAGANGNAHGIAVYGNSIDPINQLFINNNELHDLNLGASEALVVNGNVAGFTISNNSIHHVDNIAIDVIGFEETAPMESVDQARDGVVKYNQIAHVSSFGNPAYGDVYSAGGIYVDGGTNVVIERNTVSYSDFGIEIASEHQNRSTSQIIVKNNLIYFNRLAGVTMGGFDNLRGSSENNEVSNNTFFYNDSLQDGNGEILLQYDVRNTSITNNIFYSNPQSLFIANEYTENLENTVDYNIYFNAEGVANSEWQWKTEIYQGLEQFRTETGNDGNSLFTDPDFVSLSLPDFHLRESSAALNSGENIANFLYDFDGQTRISEDTIDIGADQHQFRLPP